MYINPSNTYNAGCNMSQCSRCNMRYICANSQYNLLTKLVTSNQEPSTNSHDEFAQVIDTLVHITQEQKQEYNKLVNEVNALKESISKKEVESKEPQQIDNTDLAVIQPSEIESGPVLIEKKGLFGKTKWVPEK